MLATGGTLETVITMLSQREAASVTAVCCWPRRRGWTGSATVFPDDDPLPVRWSPRPWMSGLNEPRLLVPGLGDAGDRLFGEI